MDDEIEGGLEAAAAVLRDMDHQCRVKYLVAFIVRDAREEQLAG